MYRARKPRRRLWKLELDNILPRAFGRSLWHLEVHQKKRRAHFPAAGVSFRGLRTPFGQSSCEASKRITFQKDVNEGNTINPMKVVEALRFRQCLFCRCVAWTPFWSFWLRVFSLQILSPSSRHPVLLRQSKFCWNDTCGEPLKMPYADHYNATQNPLLPHGSTVPSKPNNQLKAPRNENQKTAPQKPWWEPTSCTFIIISKSQQGLWLGWQ